MSDETNVLKKIWLALSNTATLFRLNTGQAWIGKGKPIRTFDGTVRLPYAQPISVGFSYPNTKSVIGVADLLGWSPVIITQNMVGRTVAVFTSIECKNSKGGRKSEAQIQWMDRIKSDGGIAGFAKSPEEALEIIQNYTK